MIKNNHPSLLNTLTPKQFAILLGEVTALLMLSPLHRKFQIRDIADILLPILNLRHYRIYRTPDGKPVALVTWARFSPAIEAEYLGGKIMFSEAELASGDRLYFLDFIAPYGHTKQVFRDLRSRVFPNDLAYTLRYTDQGIARPNVIKLYGVNYKKSMN